MIKAYGVSPRGKLFPMSEVSSRWRIGLVTLIVFTPFYAWFFPCLFLDKLPPLRLVIIIFWVYLVLGYFVVKAILKRADRRSR